jgi:hypothetical protein
MVKFLTSFMSVDLIRISFRIAAIVDLDQLHKLAEEENINLNGRPNPAEAEIISVWLDAYAAGVPTSDGFTERAGVELPKGWVSYANTLTKLPIPCLLTFENISSPVVVEVDNIKEFNANLIQLRDDYDLIDLKVLPYDSDLKHAIPQSQLTNAISGNVRAVYYDISIDDEWSDILTIPTPEGEGEQKLEQAIDDLSTTYDIPLGWPERHMDFRRLDNLRGFLPLIDDDPEEYGSAQNKLIGPGYVARIHGKNIIYVCIVGI